LKQPVFLGSGTALVTPFTSDGVDYAALRSLLDFQLSSGTDAIIICGTTGEAATMSYSERMRTIETTVRYVDGRVPVIAGTGSNSTETAITLSKDAVLAGVDALLVVTPYYNKATQPGLIRHYTSIADIIKKPMILYNVPGRTGVKCVAETYAALSAHPNIIGVKEASGDFALIQKTRELCPQDFYIWSGNDEDTTAIMLLGGKGVISVAANIVPKDVAEMTHFALNGDYLKAAEKQLALRRLIDVLFREVNPIPVKASLSLMGRCQDILRSPLCSMDPKNLAELKQVLHDYHLLPSPQLAQAFDISPDISEQ